jgi:AefR-like transcriptional repressor, C-terminal domain
MTGSLAFDGAAGNAIGSLIRNRSLSRRGGNILRSGDPAEAQMMTDWLCRQGEHGKIELEDTQTAVEMLRGMMVMDTQRAVMLGQRAVPDQAEIAVRAKQCARLFLNGCVVR